VLVTISTTRDPATDLGFLLHKHPEKVQSFPVTAGTAHVFYPEATARRCTAALILDVDPVALVRGTRGQAAEAFTLGQYVNDRPYAASSMLAVALSRVFKTAMAGRCEARPELAAAPLPLELHVPALPCRGGPGLAGRLFEPLGWQVTADPVPLDPQFPGWGDSRYVDLRLSGSLRLADALTHLYVLLPVLDDAKHYWVSTDEIDKLVRAGRGWLAGHPERDLITRRYLAHQAGMQTAALARLAEADDSPAEALDNATDEPRVTGEAPVAGEAPVTGEPPVAGEPGRARSLAELRADAVLEVLRDAGARTVADLGCGDGKLLVRLLADAAFSRVIGADVSVRALELAGRRLTRLAERQQERAELLQSSLVYRDARLAGLDAAVLMEVIEHIDPPRLGAMARAVFGFASPGTVVVTTPNAEHNVRYPALEAGAFRHRDHRFEWTRPQFRGWAEGVAAAFGYAVRFLPVGSDDRDVGPPTQMAIFSRTGTTGTAS
jgi:3' terminal RNA ribose 2'-O-methyltransferase Hen1